MYLLGEAPNVEGLESARLNVTMNWSANPYEQSKSWECPLAETPWLKVRKRHQPWTPGNVLTPGFNELLADYMFLGIFTETGKYTFEFRVKLPKPDGRLLFGFEQAFYLEQRPW